MGNTINKFLFSISISISKWNTVSSEVVSFSIKVCIVLKSIRISLSEFSHQSQPHFSIKQSQLETKPASFWNKIAKAQISMPIWFPAQNSMPVWFFKQDSMPIWFSEQNSMPIWFFIQNSMPIWFKKKTPCHFDFLNRIFHLEQLFLSRNFTDWIKMKFYGRLMTTSQSNGPDWRMEICSTLWVFRDVSPMVKTSV